MNKSISYCESTGCILTGGVKNAAVDGTEGIYHEAYQQSESEKYSGETD